MFQQKLKQEYVRYKALNKQSHCDQILSTSLLCGEILAQKQSSGIWRVLWALGNQMKSILFVMFSILLVSGCAAIIPERMAAQYEARNGDFIIIEQSGDVYWSPLSKVKDKLQFVGKLIVVSSNSLNPRLNVHAASAYVATVLSFEPDFKQLNIDWGVQVNDAFKDRAKKYERSN